MRTQLGFLKRIPNCAQHPNIVHTKFNTKTKKMKRQMHKNSLLAYQEVLPKISNQKIKICKSLEFLGKATMHQIAKYMGVPLNTISGRFKDLREDGFIKSFGSTEKRRTIWELNPERKEYLELNK